MASCSLRMTSSRRASGTETRVGILGEKLLIERLDGTDNFQLPGQPVAIISNVMLEYRPAPPPKPKPVPRRR